MYKLVGADNQEYGPASLEQVRAWIREGRANAHTWVMRQGETQWLRLGGLPEFAADFGSASPPPAPTFAAVPSVPGGARTNSMAVLGFICGLIAITVGCCCCYGLPFNVLGIVFSAIGLSQINADPRQQGRSLAVAGLALSIASLVLAGLLGIFYGALMEIPDFKRHFNLTI